MTKPKKSAWENEIKTETKRDRDREMGTQTKEKGLCKDQHKYEWENQQH